MILEEIVDLMDVGCKEAGITFKGIKICELGKSGRLLSRAESPYDNGRF
jgi:hypothetical protein